MCTDSALAYEAHARDYLAARDGSDIGARVVDDWARSLPDGADVLELACGGGLPVTRVLDDAGLDLRAVDASPTLVSEFRIRFPHIPVDCSCVLQSTFYDRQFSAIIAIGLVFLLEPAAQATLMKRLGAHLRESGHLLFSAPAEAGRWTDLITGQPCESLGYARYASLLADAGLRITATFDDEGRNHHYAAVKSAPGRVRG